jgi:regulator of protease activity HflC (stomatin/prohibitin superfamily)
MSKKPTQTEEVAPSEELLAGVEGDENTTVTPVEPEAPVVDEAPSEEEVAAEQAKAEEEARKAAEEQEAENAKVAAEAQAAEKAKADAEAEAAAQVPTPAENAGSDIARAIAEGMKGATEKNFSLQPDAGVEPRFSVVRNKATGEVMLRENGTGHLSKVQLESIEEKEASIQGSEVEEI